MEGEREYVFWHILLRDAVYEATITVPRYSEQGTWRLNQVSVSDNALNWDYEFQIPATFDVVRTENRP